jgi:hypothetical protein
MSRNASMSRTMNDSQARTITVPGTPTGNPAAIAVAMTDRAMRVLVSNVGATALRIAFSSSSLGQTTAEGVDHFQINPGPSDGFYFLLAPKQRLYAVSIGSVGRVSVHMSDVTTSTLESEEDDCL